ncbi:MAG: hypothetical protein AB1486_32820 [Planctomycetota bacterium]
MSWNVKAILLSAPLASALLIASALAAGQHGTAHQTGTFSGAKANSGFVTHTKDGTKNVLTLSDDFVMPETPDPHWQVVDSKGNTYLLQRLMVKGDKLNKSIVVPAYVTNIAKVQIWCAWAEVNLGEAAFADPVN